MFACVLSLLCIGEKDIKLFEYRVKYLSTSTDAYSRNSCTYLVVFYVEYNMG